MKILAVETAADTCSVALYLDGQITENFQSTARKHGQVMLPMIDALLSEQGVSLSALDAVACGCGPGSFTGLRIGMGVAQGIAFAHKLPMVTVSSLENLAFSAWQRDGHARIISALDARMHEIYLGVYEYLAETQRFQLHAEEMVGAADVLSPVLDGNGWYGAGNAWAMPALQQRFAAEVSAWNAEIEPRAVATAQIAVARVLRGEVCQAAQALPHYIRHAVSGHGSGTQLSNKKSGKDKTAQ